MRVLTLDCGLDAPGIDHETFSSSVSLFEYDVVIWDPVNTFEEIVSRCYDKYGGLPCLSDHESSLFNAHILRRNKDFLDFIELGRTLVVFSAPPQECYIATGEKKTSGTGRNQKVTRIVEKVDLLQVLPVSPRSCSESTGSSMHIADSGFADLWRPFKDRWYYRAVLDEYPGAPIAKIPGTDKVIASIERYRTGGHFIQIPDLDDAPELQEGDESASADAGGGDPAAVAIMSWLRSLTADAPTQPDWARDMQFPEDYPREAERQKLESELQSIVAQIEEVRSQAEKDAAWKQLITASGPALEQIVADAFVILGFEDLGQVRGRRDLRIKLGDSYAVVEVKGVGKSASEAHAAQLEKWVSEALIDHDTHHKGILVVNAWKDIPLRDRDQATFPDQMLRYSTTREHCLLSGFELLAAVRSVLAGRESAEAMGQKIMSCIGEFKSGVGIDDIFPVAGAGEIPAEA